MQPISMIKLEIFLMFGGADRPAFVDPVLMTVDAVQRVMLPVQEKPFVGIDPEEAHSERLRDAVNKLAPVANLDGDLVEVGIGAAVPEMRLGQLDRLHRVAGCRWPVRSCRELMLATRLAAGIGNRAADGGRLRRIVRVAKFGRDFQFGRIRSHAVLPDVNAG